MTYQAMKDECANDGGRIAGLRTEEEWIGLTEIDAKCEREKYFQYIHNCIMKTETDSLSS